MPFRSPRDLPNPETEPTSPTMAGRTLGAHEMVPSCELNIGYFFTRTSLVAQTVKSLPAMQETSVQSLGWKDPLEKEMSIYSSILA